MATLRFRFATMGSGKSAEIISVKHNYDSIEMEGLVLIPKIDTASNGKIKSRNGKSIKAKAFDKNTNLYTLVKNKLKKNPELSYVIVDESNFLTNKQVEELGDIVDYLNIDVMAYGLLTDFQTDSFDGSKRLFEIADIKEELTARKLCHCGKKAIFNSRVVNGNLVSQGEKIVIKNDNDDIKYVPLCRKCFKLGKWKKEKKKSL